jgi:peroxin-1
MLKIYKNILDVHHVDVSEYTSTPITSITPLFQYWYDIASWHRPSILVLDNLHTLLSAEVEVTPSLLPLLLLD